MRVAPIGVFVCLLTATALAVGPEDVATRSRDANVVVVGSVVEISARFDTNRFGDQLIVTTAAVAVEETLKGSPVGVVHVTFEGGTVGDLTLKVSDMPSPRPGDRAVLFLDANELGYVPHGRGADVYLPLDGRGRARGTTMNLGQIRRAVRGNLP